MEETPFLAPTLVSDNVYAISAVGALPIFVKTNSKPLKTEDIFLTKDNYEKFKHIQAKKKANGKRNKRLAVMESFFKKKGLDTSSLIPKEQHCFSKRQELWDALGGFEPQLFPPTSSDTINKFFNKNGLVSF